MGLIGPETFREFFSEEIDALSERYGGIGIHCCADAEHQFENFYNVKNLKLMNLYRPPESIRAAYKLFARRCVQCHGTLTNGRAAALPFDVNETYPAGSRIIFREYAEDIDDARRLLERYNVKR